MYLSWAANHHTEKFLNRLAGKTDIEDAFKRLDMLTKEETGMTMAQNLVTTHIVKDAVKAIQDGTHNFRKLARPILIS
jgi:hypothetical protein